MNAKQPAKASSTKQSTSIFDMFSKPTRRRPALTDGDDELIPWEEEIRVAGLMWMKAGRLREIDAMMKEMRLNENITNAADEDTKQTLEYLKKDLKE